MRITFFGAAGEVTGSCYLVETGETRFLVDCGMFQGGREAYRKNLSALQCEPRSLDFVVLTHAHLDHCGLIPRLVNLGFKGPVYATAATADLAEVILLDSAHIQEKETEWNNRHHHARHVRRGYESAPLYTITQAQWALRQFRRLAYGEDFSPAPGIRMRFLDAGHILGSAILEAWVQIGGQTKKVVFSGDLGQPARPVVRDPAVVSEADVLLVESTYGNRLHKPLSATEDELVGALHDTLKGKKGNVVIPAFAVGRTQELLFILTDLVRRGRVGNLVIYVDSPMSLSATRLTLKHESLLDDETRNLLAWQRAHPTRPTIRFVQDVEESKALNTIREGAVIISASGMCDAGRIKHHLLYNLGRRECAVVIAGFQAAGTLGRRLVDGAKRVTLLGQSVNVKASIYTIGGLSAHADRNALLGWLRNFRHPPGKTFVVHGEADTAASFADGIRSELGWANVVTPRNGEVSDCA